MTESTHPVVFFDIGCKDLNKTTTFYQSLFGWTPSGIPLANLINTGSLEGIQGQITALGHEPHNYVIVYIQVDNISLQLDRIITAGGQKLVGPVTLPNGKQFAWFKDLEGTTMGLVTKV
ncbi:hypothetical protein [Xanthocytophaga flava]|uniref:hypothetical protein n=1 Tax=Xanthocytophaga flava TaxID=3048013 RepID=UPI0028D02AAD|nr:hypothetical protein [Xanthocytophaga flavus]MDJ1472806.1 hypothetical protein [Xanthocytophaga flavus]